MLLRHSWSSLMPLVFKMKSKELFLGIALVLVLDELTLWFTKEETFITLSCQSSPSLYSMLCGRAGKCSDNCARWSKRWSKVACPHSSWVKHSVRHHNKPCTPAWGRKDLCLGGSGCFLNPSCCHRVAGRAGCLEPDVLGSGFWPAS